MTCFPYKGIEPYVILRRHPLVPLFDPSFYDYGGNKQILIERLRYFCMYRVHCIMCSKRMVYSKGSIWS